MPDQQTTPRYWIAIASAEHARRGAEGFMQVCHGKGGPLRRTSPGDGVIYYAPTETFHGKDRLQAFVLIGHVATGEVYQHDMGEGFVPFRRHVIYADAEDAPIRPLLDQLDFTKGKSNWGYAFRFGLLEISHHDFALIAEAMNAKIV